MAIQINSPFLRLYLPFLIVKWNLNEKKKHWKFNFDSWNYILNKNKWILKNSFDHKIIQDFVCLEYTLF